MTDKTAHIPDFDADVPEDFDSPHAMFRDLRQRCPVAWSDAMGGFWAVTKYDDIVRVLTDWQTFTTTIQNVVPRVATTQRRPPLHLDPPGNSPYRNAITRLMTPARLSPWRPKIEALVEELLAPLVERGEGDICRDFSFILPIAILADFFRLPDENARRIRVVGSEFNMALQMRDDENVRRYSDELYGIARELIEDRRISPQDPDVDPISSLLAVRVDGEALPHDMILGALRQFLMVGIVAPTTFIASAVVHLARHREHHTLLRNDNSLIPDAVEEMLRLYTPYRGFARTARRDVRFGDKLVREGDVLAAVFTSGNRDEDVFESPDEFDLDRRKRDLLTFGRGPHMCPGAPLARLLLEIAVEGIVNRTRGIDIAGEMTMTNWPEYGPLSVPIRIER
ncbi:MAG TPA: cytochrome P450 [Gammaproteobacteria bacterium]|nr:cytochrome P450 [Gammaproteobacteria bacterium]